MRINRETHYAIKAICHLFENSDNCVVTAEEISANKNIPKKFLYRILRKLKEGEIIEINKGCNGGYKLIADCKQISLLDIVQIIEGDINLVYCSTNKEFCEKIDNCLIYKEFNRIEFALKNELNKKNLFDLINREKKCA